MNTTALTLIGMDEKSAIIEGYDIQRERWLRIQLDMANKYVQYLMGLASKGLLLMPIGALAQLSEQKGIKMKMTMLDYDSRRFLGDVSSVLDDDALSVRALSKRGYDSDGETITFKGAKMWPAAVLDVPSDSDSNDIKQLRAIVRTIAAPTYHDAFERYLRAGMKSMDSEAAYVMLDQRDKKALTEGRDVDGGYFVPADFSGAVLSRVAATSIVRSRAKVIPTSRDRYTCPAFAPHGSLPSVYSSGFVGTWSPEAALWADNDPGFEVFSVPIRKLRVGARISRDLSHDAGGVEWLTQNGADNLAVGEDAAFLTGSGINGAPLGVLNTSGISTVDIEGSTANTISNTTGADGSGSKMLTLAGSLPSQYQRDAVLIAASATEASINKLVDGNRAFLFPRVQGPDGRRQLIGYSVEDSPHIPLEGVDANKVVLLANMQGYIVAQRSLITMRLGERFADVDQIAVILTDRIGGAVHNVDAFRIGVV